MIRRPKIDREAVKSYLKRTAKQPTFYLFALLVGLLIVAFSTVRLDPLSDDGHYRIMIAEHPGFLNYLSYTYHYLNGRIVANTLMYVMLQLDFMPLWVLLSTLATVSIAFHMARMLGRSVGWQAMSLALGMMMCIGFRVLSSSMFWFTGAIFYLWPIAVLFYLLSGLCDRYQSGATLSFSWKGCVDLILSVAIAFWGEQFALVLIGFWLCYVAAVVFLKKKKPSWFEIVLLLLVLGGFLAMFYAPSQAIRMNNVYGYAAYEGGLGYLLANGIYWTYQSLFVNQRLLMILFGVLTLLCVDRTKHRSVVVAFEIVLCIPIVALLTHGIHFGACVDVARYIYQFLYLPDAGFSIGTVMPYLFWTLYTALLLTVFLMNTQKKGMTGLVVVASVASLVIMWFSTTMYASGNRTCSFFCFAMIALMLKLLMEREKSYLPIVTGVGVVNLLLLIVPLAKQFVIFY